MQHKQKELKIKSRKLKVLVVATIFTLTFSLSTVSAQESVNATGGNASGSGGSASYSVGQVVYTTNTGTTGSVAQGVQQPYEISVITGIEEAEGINISLKAYPNPTTGYLQLKVESEKLNDLSFQLYDMNGKLLQTKKITSTVNQIDMSSYVSATYFVRVITESKLIKEFKIIKTQWDSISEKMRDRINPDSEVCPVAQRTGAYREQQNEVKIKT